MEIQDKVVLVLGGWGLVGRAIIRRLIPENPKQIVVTSLKKSEAQEEVKLLRKEFPDMPKNYFVPWWGNILVRNEFKDMNRADILNDPKKRAVLLGDIMDDLDDKTLKASALYKLISKYKPDIFIDCINTATAIAYQDVYTAYKGFKHKVSKKISCEQVIEESEKLIAGLYVPQLIRHIQILYNSMHQCDTKIYIKIGTSGTGGMGLNIPYTHSEEKPSRVLLSKSAVAGAHTLLLFLMARTPDAAITKEIKPTAAIAWKKIEFNTIKKKGKPIELYDIPFDDAIPLGKKFKFSNVKDYGTSGVLKSVYIDTGENGIFSKGEFEAITAHKQMEYVTPEEIAIDTIFEIRGGNTGHDIINALDNAAFHPTYRAGYIQHFATEQLAELEAKHNTKSVAFEMLGPPRLSKLLFEINLLSRVCGTMKAIPKKSPKVLSDEITELLKTNDGLRNEILSIGIPILLPDGKSLLRGKEIKIPVKTGDDEIPLNKKIIDTYASEGWIDLREKNWKFWKTRIKALMDEAMLIPETDTSSGHVRTRQYWNNFEEINEGRIVSWIFIHEEKGRRMKD